MKRNIAGRISLIASCLYLAVPLAGCDASASFDVPAFREAPTVRAMDPDAALAEKVEKSLARMPYGVEVTVRGGRVELWGTVDSTAEARRIVVTAAGVVGVRAVESHLKVDSGA